MQSFQTFKPHEQRLRRYISYYYLDIDDAQEANHQYICYPHFNTTLSFYKSHVFEYKNHHTRVDYQRNSSCLKILTPLREEPLIVSQRGPKHKLTIVFEPLGLNHFVNDRY